MCDQCQVFKTQWIEFNKVKKRDGGLPVNASPRSPLAGQGSHCPAAVSVGCEDSHPPPSQDKCSGPVGATFPGSLHTPSIGIPYLLWWLPDIGAQGPWLKLGSSLWCKSCPELRSHSRLAPPPTLFCFLPFLPSETTPLRNHMNPCLSLCF